MTTLRSSLPSFRPAAALVAAASLLLLHGCGGGDPLTEAKKTLDAAFAAIQRGDYQAALDFYSPSFFASTPRDEWANTLQVALQSFGRPQSYAITNSLVEKTRGLDGGTYVALQCTMTYQKQAVNEDLLLVRKRGQDKYEIQGHAINTRGGQNAPAAAAQPAQP